MTATAPHLVACPTGCGRGYKPGRHMCDPCWQNVPDYLKRAVTTTRRRFQETHETAHLEEYLAAKEAAFASIR